MKTTTQRGSAMITTILVLLILSAVGAAAVFLMRQESAQSASVMDAKLALYAAETGLRRGEHILGFAGVMSLNTLLGYDSGSDPETPAMVPPRPVKPTNPRTSGTYDVGHLGTYLLDGGVPQAVQRVQIPVQGNAPVRDAFFSLCVRDNPEDIDETDPTSPDIDNDSRLRLVSVGWVQSGTRVVAVKILEEEYNFAGATASPSAQKLVNAGGTGSTQFGG